MGNFIMDNNFPSHVIYGPGAISRIEWDLEMENVLIITDRGLLQTDNISKIIRVFPKAEIYSELGGEPTSAMVDEALRVCRSHSYDLVVGLGGGSALDTAKVVAALLRNTVNVSEVFGKDLLGARPVRLGLIPTTAGTGSEATPNSIFKDSADGVKKAVISQELIPDWVVLDPELTRSLPAPITASTGIDAFCHCIESALSVNANAMLLPWILDYNRPVCEAQLMELALYLHSEKPIRTAADIVDLTFDYVRTLPVPKTLDEVGIGAECIPELAAEAMEQTRLLNNNPRSMNQAEAEAIYQKFLHQK
jgi:alcohol dehydrogenase class IV